MHRFGWFALLLATCMLACSAPAPEPTGSSSSRLTTDSIADRYIVVFHKGATASGVAGRSVPDVATSIGGQYGGKVVHTYKHALQGAAMVLPAAAVENLRHDSRVAYVEPDGIVSINATEGNATWGIDRVDQRMLPLDQTYIYPDQAGEGVHAFVIDTGVYAGHSEFALPDGTSRVVPGRDFIDNDDNPDDCNGHGTHVAGTLGGNTYGLAKKVTLHSVRVLDCDGYGPESGVIAGIDWVTDWVKTANPPTPAVANMSLGGDFSQAENDAVTNSIAAGIAYGIAAGNSSDDACSYSPASTPNAITVGATTSSDSRTDFSSYGSCLDIFAPGKDITSAWIGSKTATNTINGTSMATPHVVGSAALWLGLHPTATPAEVAQFLTWRATPNRIPDPGEGSPNLLLYMGNMVGGGTAPQVDSVGATPSVFESSKAPMGRVLLTDVAPAGGIPVALSSSDPAVVVPGAFTVPEGSQGAAFPITASQVSNPTVVTLSATYPAAVTVTSTITVLPSPTPASLTVSPVYVESGLTATATVTLSGPAPASGAVVALSSSDLAVATVPPTMTIPAGSTSGQISITTLPQFGTHTISISAAYHGLTRSATLIVVYTPAIWNLTVNPKKLEGGGSSTLTVQLNAYARAGGAVVALSSSDPAALVPASVTIPEGAMWADFPIATTTVGVERSVTITGTYPAAFSASTVLTVVPYPTPASLVLEPADVPSGASCTGTVTLSGPAPAGGSTILLESSDTSAATVPATFVIPGGASTGTFQIATVANPVIDKYPRISATLHGLTATALLRAERVLPEGNAVYDPTLRAPKCSTPAPICDTGRLVDGRAGLGPEINAPNTIANSCGDGPYGDYHGDESLDRLTISTIDGSNLAPGKQVKIEGTVWSYSDPKVDSLDLYLTTNAAAASPTWVLLTSLTPLVRDASVVTYTFTLPATGSSSLWAVRGNFRNEPGQAVCPTGTYTDHDDLIFALETTGPFNEPPRVNAGADQTVTLPASAALAGTASDDGLPNPPGTLTIAWSQTGGPGTVTFGNATALATAATFSTGGSYTLRLTASDGDQSSSDDVVITVHGGSSPCTGLCTNPTNFTVSGTYQSGNLGAKASCYQTTSTIQSGKCGNFVSPRTLKVNGTAENCNGANWAAVPAKRNGGYCIQITAGSRSTAYFTAAGG